MFCVEFTSFSCCFQTLDLLCHITNASNVETVCEKLLSFLKSTTDVDMYFRAELVDRVTELAERYPFDSYPREIPVIDFSVILNHNHFQVCCKLNNCLKYAPDNSWYILTMNEIFELGGSLVRETVSHNLMRFLAEGE